MKKSRINVGIIPEQRGEIDFLIKRTRKWRSVNSFVIAAVQTKIRRERTMLKRRRK